MKKISKLLACSVIALVSTITDHSRDLSMDLLKASAEEVDVFENLTFEYLKKTPSFYSRTNNVVYIDRNNFFNTLCTDSLPWYGYQQGLELDGDNLPYNWVYDHFDFDFTINNSIFDFDFIFDDLSDIITYSNKYLDLYKTFSDKFDDVTFTIPFIQMNEIDLVYFVFDPTKDSVFLASPDAFIKLDYHNTHGEEYANFKSGSLKLSLEFVNSPGEYQVDSITINRPDKAIRTSPNETSYDIGLNAFGISTRSNYQLNIGQLKYCNNIINVHDVFYYSTRYDEVPDFSIEISNNVGQGLSTVFSCYDSSWYTINLLNTFGNEKYYEIKIKDFETIYRNLSQGQIKVSSESLRSSKYLDYYGSRVRYFNKTTCINNYVYNHDAVAQCFIDTYKYNVSFKSTNTSANYEFKWWKPLVYLICPFGGLKATYDIAKYGVESNVLNSQYYYQSFAFDFYFDKERKQPIQNIQTLTIKYQKGCSEEETDSFITSSETARNSMHVNTYSINDLKKTWNGYVENGFVKQGNPSVESKLFIDTNNAEHDYSFINKVENKNRRKSLINYLDPLSITYLVPGDNSIAIWTAYNNSNPVYIVDDTCFYFNGESATEDGYLCYVDPTSGAKAIALDDDNDGKASLNEVIGGHGDYSHVDNDVSPDVSLNPVNWWDNFMNVISSGNSIAKKIIQVVLGLVGVILIIFIIKLLISLVNFITSGSNRRRHRR